jgi:hypothetical protein
MRIRGRSCPATGDDPLGVRDNSERRVEGTDLGENIHTSLLEWRSGPEELFKEELC